MKKELIKWTSKIKNLFSAKENVKEMRSQATEWEGM